MVRVLVVLQLIDLLLQLLGFGGSQYLQLEAMRQANFLLEGIESTIHDQESNLAVE